MSTARHTEECGDHPGVEREGRAIPMTVFSLLRPGGIYFQRLVFAIGRHRPSAVRTLSFIHFARLAVLRQFPDHGQPPDYLPQPLQLFESNYNGTFAQYIDTFVEEIPTAMRELWGTSYGFPFCLPLKPFKEYILKNEFPIAHYYVANPDASVTMVGSALRIVEACAQFRHDALDLDPVAFAQAFRDFITSVQDDL